MSRTKSTIVENKEFVARFVEICGTTRPAEIAQLFNISYQAAKNYLDGRYPDTNVLISIGSSTPYSIHWLLTGFGPKIAKDNEVEESLSGNLKILIRNECERIVAEILTDKLELSKEKVLIFREKDIKEERVLEESNPVSLKLT